MGVLKWLRRERVTVTTNHNATSTDDQPVTQITTIRTEEYKRDLAEFQARRSSGVKESPKKKCGRHSLPISCADCSKDGDNTFNYEKNSAVKCKKKRSQSSSPQDAEAVPNIQFLFQNQVFMPGNLFSPTRASNTRSRRQTPTSPDVKYIEDRVTEISDDLEQPNSPPVFFKNNSLPFDVQAFLDSARCEEEVDGSKSSNKDSRGASSNRDDSCEEKMYEVLGELKNFDRWADEQLQVRSPTTSSASNCSSELSILGLPLASTSSVDVGGGSGDGGAWTRGRWGTVPVQLKSLRGVTMDAIAKNLNTEVNILRKFRHPNIILLMGFYGGFGGDVRIVCESCAGTLHSLLHVQGAVLSVQKSVEYALDVANALVFLRMQGYVHTGLASTGVAISERGAAKLAELGSCARLAKSSQPRNRDYAMEPHYVNVEDTQRSSDTVDLQPLIPKRPSETYLADNAVRKTYAEYRNSEGFRWQAPELFVPDEGAMVYPCSKSDVYSLCVILWECSNATLPWANMSYDNLRELYTRQKTGLPVPNDGRYPGCLLSLLQKGLTLSRQDRIDLTTLEITLHSVKRSIEDMEYILIPARADKKNSSSPSPNTPTDCYSPVHKNGTHQAMVHNKLDSSIGSDKKDDSPMYETIRKNGYGTQQEMIRCEIETPPEKFPMLRFNIQQENDSSACSTPISKVKAKIKDVGTPGLLHRSDSTEYCSIMSPCNRIVNFGLNDESVNQSTVNRTTKLSKSLTPQSYRPLQIKVPDVRLDVKSVGDTSLDTRTLYRFDIKNYSLPNTPIARSNKLRKNAWLSGDISEAINKEDNAVSKDQNEKGVDPTTPSVCIDASAEKETYSFDSWSEKMPSTNSSLESAGSKKSPRSVRRPPLSKENDDEINTFRELIQSWPSKSSTSSHQCHEEDALVGVNVKPLVAIHEKWIYEANKTHRPGAVSESKSLSRPTSLPVKPASHCASLQPAAPPVTRRSAGSRFRPPPYLHHGAQSEQFCQARENIAKMMNVSSHRNANGVGCIKRDTSKETISENGVTSEETKTDRSTDTNGIEEFIKQLIHKEFQHLIYDPLDSETHNDIKKGVSNIMLNLDKPSDTNVEKPDSTTKFNEGLKYTSSMSKVRINGNNKPLLQIVFSRSGDNRLQVFDDSVRVTLCDSKVDAKEKLDVFMEEASEDVPAGSLKRCQTFSAIQEARSTEDLYIDDDITGQMQENFGGRVKLIPLHGSLHEILCEKEDDCCLVKVKQENGCDSIYFKCDNSDTEPRDAIDGKRETVVFKRSISIEERIQRVVPRPKKKSDTKIRPKSESFLQTEEKVTPVLSNSTPSLEICDENDTYDVICDTSSDECLKCQADDDFEMIERKIEEDIAKSELSSLNNSAGKEVTLGCGGLEKISEENLAELDINSV